MTKIMQIMKLDISQIDEYEKRHHELWPEMRQGLKDYGVEDYDISIDRESGQLYAHLIVKDVKRYKEFANTKICRRWWYYMEPLMLTNLDGSPVVSELQKVFDLNEERKNND